MSRRRREGLFIYLFFGLYYRYFTYLRGTHGITARPATRSVGSRLAMMLRPSRRLTLLHGRRARLAFHQCATAATGWIGRSDCGAPRAERPPGLDRRRRKIWAGRPSANPVPPSNSAECQRRRRRRRHDAYTRPSDVCAIHVRPFGRRTAFRSVFSAAHVHWHGVCRLFRTVSAGTPAFGLARAYTRCTIAEAIRRGRFGNRAWSKKGEKNEPLLNNDRLIHSVK